MIMPPILLVSKKGELGMEENIALEEKAVACLIEKGCSITTAESCTGGMIAASLVNVAGVSEIFQQGYITYSDEAKHRLLGVEEDILSKYGAVSEQVAAQMAAGAAKAAGTDAALSATGIAGPDGGTDDKPVGLVYIGCYFNGRTVVKKHLFSGIRREIRYKTTEAAINLLLQCLTEQQISL